MSTVQYYKAGIPIYRKWIRTLFICLSRKYVICICYICSDYTAYKFTYNEFWFKVQKVFPLCRFENEVSFSYGNVYNDAL